MTTEATSLADDLRQLADLIDANPDLGLHPSSALRLYTDQPGSFADAVRALARVGRVDKVRPDTGLFQGVVHLSPTFDLVVLDYSREIVCERVQVGVEIVEQPIMEQVGIETVEQPVYEWKCPESILVGAPS